MALSARRNIRSTNIHLFLQAVLELAAGGSVSAGCDLCWWTTYVEQFLKAGQPLYSEQS